MTLVCHDTAAISIGVSCQTTHQLSNHRILVSQMLRRQMEDYSSFFDWTLCDARAAASIVASRYKRVAPGDIDVLGKFFWLPEHGVWFFHDSDDLSTAGRQRVAEKYSYLLSNFWALAAKKRRYFLLGNTQNNLNETSFEGRRSSTLSAEIVSQVERAIAGSFEHGANRIVTVAYADRTSDVIDGAHLLSRDDSRWQGDTEQWAKVLGKALRPSLARRLLDIGPRAVRRTARTLGLRP